MSYKNSASQITAFLLILLSKLFPDFMLLHKSERADFVTMTQTDSQEAVFCHLQNISSVVFASIFYEVVNTPTFLSMKPSDLSIDEKQNLHDVPGLLLKQTNLRSPEHSKIC